MPKKGGLGQFVDLRGGGGKLGKKEWGGVFEEGVDTPMPTMIALMLISQIIHCLLL